MKKILIISPHLSTGGQPQYVLKKIDLLKDTYDVYCIEYNYLSPDYVVQRNLIKKLITENFYSIGEQNINLIETIEKINPDIIWIEEISETFMTNHECEFIYKKDRSWKILETTHTSEDLSIKKSYLPDKFMFVSDWSVNQYKKFDVDSCVIQYPIDLKNRNQEHFKAKLNFDIEYKHVLCVGLFTSGKNQGYAIEIADKLKDEKVIFHFVGNTASNFSNYWQPLLDNLPVNCIIHGEKENVDEYIQACDLFLFPSKFELNPLVIKEVLCYDDLPILMFNLHTYCGHYDTNDKVYFLNGNLIEDVDLVKINLYTNEVRPILVLSTSRRLNYFKQTIQSLKENVINLKNTFKYVWLLDDRSSSSDRNEMEFLLKDIFGDKYRCVYFNDEKKLKFIDKFNFIKNTCEPNDIVFFLEDDWVLSEPLDVLKHSKNLMNCNWTQISFADPLYIQEEDIIKEYSIDDEYWKNPFPKEFKHPNEWCDNGTYKYAIVRMNNWGGNPSLVKGFVYHDDNFEYDKNFEAIFADIKTRNQVFHQKCYFKHIGKYSLIDEIDKVKKTYKDIEGWFSYEWLYDKFAKTSKAGDKIVEIGSWFGKSTKYLSDKLNEYNKKVDLIVIDTFKGTQNEELHKEIVGDASIYQDFYYNVNNPDITIIKESSHEASKLFSNGSIDYLMIDGDHSYDGVKQDIQDYFYKVKPGGIISGDDYKAFQCVRVAVDEFFVGADMKTSDNLHWYYKIPKIQVIHMSTLPKQKRAEVSIANIKELSRYNIDITYIENELYNGDLDLENYRDSSNKNVNKGHYGCYLAHKQAIYNMSENYDYTIILEEDAYIFEDLKTFVDVVHKAIFECIKNDVYFVSFGSSPLQSELKQYNDSFDECWHQSLAHCYMIPNKYKNWYIDKFENNPWDSADMWFNHIFCHDRKTRLMTKNMYSKQLDGYSLIDKVEKKY